MRAKLLEGLDGWNACSTGGGGRSMQNVIMPHYPVISRRNHFANSAAPQPNQLRTDTATGANLNRTGSSYGCRTVYEHVQVVNFVPVVGVLEVYIAIIGCHAVGCRTRTTGSIEYPPPKHTFFRFRWVIQIRPEHRKTHCHCKGRRQ